MTYSPVLLFVYSRVDNIKKSLESLSACEASDMTDLFIFSDGPKNDLVKGNVDEVRKYIRKIKGFKSVSIIESTENKGLANSIIGGVTQIFERFNSIIVLEDDLVVSGNFLLFMNQALEYYENRNEIISISGYNMGVSNTYTEKYDVFFTQRAASWGWATWKNKWENIDWEVKDFQELKKNRKLRKEFNKMGSDMYGMLKAQQEKRNNSWAIRYCYHQFRHNLLTVYPFISKVKNIGFNDDATHTNSRYNRFETNLEFDSKKEFSFAKSISMNPRIIKEFRSKNGLRTRLKSKIINIILNLVR